MAKRINQNKAKSWQGSPDSEKDKEENSRTDFHEKETDQDDNGDNGSDLQKAALLSALDIETRREIGYESFDEDEEEEEDYENDDDEDD